MRRVVQHEGWGRGRLAPLSLSYVLTSGDGTSGREGGLPADNALLNDW